MRTSAHRFDELAPLDAYAVWRLRQDVFVLEQECLYADLDGRDTEPGTLHVLLHDDEGRLVGYCRVLDDEGGVAAVWRIGRVLLARTARGRGLADPLIRRALAECRGRDVVLAAQSPLVAWYATFGFAVDGPAFTEDGIPHTPMRLSGG